MTVAHIAAGPGLVQSGCTFNYQLINRTKAIPGFAGMALPLLKVLQTSESSDPYYR